MSRHKSKSNGRKRLRKASEENEEEEEEEHTSKKRSSARMFFADEAEKDGSDHSGDEDDKEDEEELSQETKKFIADEGEVLSEADDDDDTGHHSALAMAQDHEETDMWTSLAKKYHSAQEEVIPVHDSAEDTEEEDGHANDPDELFVALSSREKARVVSKPQSHTTKQNKLVFVDLTPDKKDKPPAKVQPTKKLPVLQEKHIKNGKEKADVKQQKSMVPEEKKKVRRVEEKKNVHQPEPSSSSSPEQYFAVHRKPTRDNVSVAVNLLATIPWIGSPNVATRAAETDATRVFWNNPVLISTMFLQQGYPALMLDYNPYTRELDPCVLEENNVARLEPFVKGNQKTMCVSFVVRQKGQVVISWWFPKSRRMEHWDPRVTDKAKLQPCAELFGVVEKFVRRRFGVRVLKSTTVPADISPWKQARSTNLLVLSGVIDELDGLWCLAATYCRFHHSRMREIWHLMRKGPFTPALAHHFIVATMMHFCDTSPKGLYAAHPERVALMEKNLSFQPLAVTLFTFAQKHTQEITLWPPGAQPQKKTSVVVVSAHK